MQQRIACALIGTAMALVAALVALLLSDALAPGRVPPMLAFWGAVIAGGTLMLGLVILDRRGLAGSPPGGVERRGERRVMAAPKPSAG